MIGITDSGVGGLAVYRLIRERLPDHAICYVADQAFAPYGYRTEAEITERLGRIQAYFSKREIRLSVVACNTATANGIDHVRQQFPGAEIIGIEPAIKQATAAHASVIVLGTDSTVANARYRALVKTWQRDATVWNIGATELVRQIESGDLASLSILEEKIRVALGQGATALVIGCTHFSFLAPAIRRRWPGLALFDGAYGVAERTVERVQALRLGTDTRDDEFYSTAGDREAWLLDEPTSFAALVLDQVATPGVNQVEYA